MRRANRRKAPASRFARLRFAPALAAWRGVGQAVLGAVVASAVLLGAAKVVAMALDQPVRRLIVDGTFQRVTPVQIEAAVAGETDKGFFSVDLGETRARVLDLDWVDRVTVRRVWPDALHVRVVEHRAAARWGERGLLNVRGELFAEDAQYAFPELPQLGGPAGSEQDVARRYLELRGPLARAELALESLSMDERGAWHVHLAGGQELKLGRSDVQLRLERFFAVVVPALSGVLDSVEYVDLRYTNGFAIGWRGEPPAGLVAVAEVANRG